LICGIIDGLNEPAFQKQSCFTAEISQLVTESFKFFRYLIYTSSSKLLIKREVIYMSTAIVGRTQSDGSIEYYYSDGGAFDAYHAGNKKPEAPEEPEEERKKSKNKIEFAKNHIDYFRDDAVWLDGVCYYPIWVYPTKNVSALDCKGKGKRFGILVKVESGTEFNLMSSIYKLKNLIDDLTPQLATEQKIKGIVNIIVGNLSKGQIPSFSPYGYRENMESSDNDRFIFAQNVQKIIRLLCLVSAGSG
jgi:hypothetical protein